MREARQHKEIQSRVIQPAKQAAQGVAIVDNRDTPQTRLMKAIQRMGMEDEELQMKPITQLQSEDEELQMKPVAQLQSEDEELQMKPIVQLQSEDDELLQGKFETIQQKPNNTGLPDNLKSGVENMSGFSMDDVRVHYNSDKPAQMQAHAYAQGTDIHIASGQEKHLPHEAWHVVQQMQGRVQPTMQMQGVNVNNDNSLEREADVMGSKVTMQTQVVSNLDVKEIDLNSSITQKVPIHGEHYPEETPFASLVSSTVNCGGGSSSANNIGANGFKLGWASLMSFTKRDRSFVLNTLKEDRLDLLLRKGEYIRENGTVNKINTFKENTLRSQIVTRGVSGCSIIIVSNEDQYVMAHLDSDDLNPKSMDFIINEVPPVEGANPNIFASIHDCVGISREPAHFVRDLVIKYYPNAGLINNIELNNNTDDVDTVNDITQGLGNHKIRILNRTVDSENMFNHSEIGLSTDANGNDYIFGSQNDFMTERNDTPFEINMNASQSVFDLLGQGIKRSVADRVAQEAAQEAAQGKCCYITTACVEYMGLADDCEELTVLREFRDNYLLKKENGKELIGLYYKHAPEIVARIRRRDDEEEILLRLYGIIKQCVDAIKRKDYEYAYITYCAMVNKLKEEFIPEVEI